MTGGAGADRLTGNQVANVLRGSGGDDVIVGAGGSDTLDGGAGTDTVSYEDHAAGEGVVVSLNGVGGARRRERLAGELRAPRSAARATTS